MTFVYQIEGCGKTYNNNKRCDTPHLNSMRYALNAITLLDKEGVVRRLVVIENFHIFYLRQYEKHFQIKCSVSTDIGI